MRPSRRLGVLSIASVGVLAVLSCGYFTQLGVELTRSQPTNPELRYVALEIDSGRVACVFEEADVVKGMPQLPPTGLRWRGNLRSFRAPDLRRSLWEFDAHSLSASPTPLAPTVRAFILACPIWCVAVPFLIAPLLWLRRRGRDAREQVKGFEVGSPGVVAHAAPPVDGAP